MRFLKNVMGLWILESCRSEWAAGRPRATTRACSSGRSALEGSPGVVFPDDPRFFNPPSMVAEVMAALGESGQPVPDDPPRLARVILDSLALRYASVVSDDRAAHRASRSRESTSWAAGAATTT